MINNNQNLIISSQRIGSPIINLSTPSSIVINLPECYAPSLSIDGLLLPNNIYCIINVTYEGQQNETIVKRDGLVKTFTLYVRDYNDFNTFTITDPTGNTKFTISSNPNNNIIDKIEWNKQQLNVQCSFNPKSQDMIVINWLYNRFTIVNTSTYFNKFN
jgi:hypothetical protein